MRPIYETRSSKETEVSILRAIEPTLIRWGRRHWGKALSTEGSAFLSAHDHRLCFERGTVFIEVKNRRVRYDTFMISEQKVASLRQMSREERARDRDSMALIAATFPILSGREVYLFNVETEPVSRRVAGRVDRGDRQDQEVCLFFDFADAVRLTLDDLYGRVYPTRPSDGSSAHSRSVV